MGFWHAADSLTDGCYNHNVQRWQTALRVDWGQAEKAPAANRPHETWQRLVPLRLGAKVLSQSKAVGCLRSWSGSDQVWQAKQER